MEKQKAFSKRKKVMMFCLVALFTFMCAGGGAIHWLNNERSSINATKTDDTTSYVMVDEIWNETEGYFNANTLSSLLQYITGNEDITASDVASTGSLGDMLATSNSAYQTNGALTSADIRDIQLNAGNTYQYTDEDTQETITTGQDVQVTFGGLTWQVVHLTQDKIGNDIVTLWLSNNKQDAWSGRLTDEGAYHGFVNGALYSDWSADWYSDSTSVSYPSAMYGQSYINAVTLNNGGTYATSTSALATATQSTDSVFAMFTMEEVVGNVTSYLVTPSEVAYQETEDANTQFNKTYYYPNEAYGTPGGSGQWYSSGYDYSSKTGYANWANNYLWLPSITETGYSGATGSSPGIWQTSQTQRANNSGTNDQINTGVGSSNSNHGTYVWDYFVLRSGDYCNAHCAYPLTASGSGYSSLFVNRSHAVRPALHLNLNSAASNSYDPTVWDGTSTEAPTLQNPAQANSEDNPYIIDSAAKLAWVSANYLGQANGAYFLQTEDLNLNNHAWTPINRGHNAFYHYDGGNHTISGINVENPSTSFENFAGLFGSMRGTSSDHGYIKNLGLISGTVTGKQNVSALLAYGEYVDIENCYNNGVLVTSTNSPSNAGGLVGGGVSITITNSFNTANITGQDSVGGVAGSMTNSTISSCYSTGSISATYRSGGIVGAMIGGSIDNTYNTGSISATSYAGGIAGNLLGTSTLPTASISSSFSIGTITGGNSGGIIGSTYCSGATSLTATNCYYNSDTTSLTLGIGQGTSSGTTALTTSQMQGTSPSMNLSSSYWTFAAGQYPTLINVVQAQTSSGGNWSVGTGSVA